MLGIFDPISAPLGWFDDWLTGDPGEFDADQSLTSASADVTVALTGISAAGVLGTLAPTTTLGLLGVTGTGAVGTLSPSSSGADVTVALTGVSAAGALGTLTPEVAVDLTRLTAHGAVGDLGVSISVPLAGVLATATAGRVSPSGGDVTTVTDTPAYSGGDTSTYGMNAPGTITLGDTGG